MSSHFFTSLETRSLRHILNASFALIFTIPLLIFFAVAVRFSLLDEMIVKLAFAGILTFSLIGFVFLRRVVEHIIGLSEKAGLIERELADKEPAEERNELKRIAESFQKLMLRLEECTANLGRRLTELAALKELADLSSKTVDITQLFGIVLEKLMVTTRAASGMMLSAEDNAGTLVIEAARGFDESLIPIKELDAHKTISGRILAMNKILVTEDPTIEEGYNPEVDRMFEGPLIATAINARGKAIGVLALSRGKNGQPFEDEETDYLATALGQIAFAFDNAQLIRDIRKSYAKLKEMQEKIISFEREAAIHHTVVTLSDKINNPLTVIHGHAELLMREYADADEQMKRPLEVILESCERCGSIMAQLREIRDPSVVEYGGTTIRMIDLDGHGEKAEPPANRDEIPGGEQ